MIRRHERPGHALRSRPQPGSPHRHPRHRAGRRAGGVLRADAGGTGRRRRSRWSRPAAVPRAASAPSTRTARIPSAPCSSGSTTAASARSCSTCARRKTASGSARWSPPPTCCWSPRRGASSTGYGLGAGALMQQYPALIVARVSPFGDEGPWADFKGSDLVHLALGGVMMNCGYDPAPGGKYDLPPIAPQMWHAYHIAGEQLAFAIVAALLYRWRTGKGQLLSCADPRGGGEVHRGRPHDVGDAARARAAPDLPSRARDHLAASVHRAHQGRALGDGQSRQRAPGRASGSIALLERYGMAAGLDAEQTGRARRADGSSPAPGRSRRSAITAWRPCSASCAPSPTRTCRGAKRRKRGCCGRRCASRTRTRSIRTGSRAEAAPTSSIPSWAARSATPRASGSARQRPGRSAAARRC